MYSIFALYSPYKAFIFLLIYLYICFIKFADTIQKKSVDWCKFAIQLQVAGLSTFCDTVGKNPISIFWKLGKN